MNAFGGTRVKVKRFIRKLRGGSQPVLAEGSDGLLYVLKFTNNLQGANLPFNESMGTELFNACALPVPTWKPILLTREFVDETPDCWMETPDGKMRPEPGSCFGSLFLGGPNVRLLEILPGTSFGRVQNRNCFWLAWAVDICCQHTDNRQALFVEDAGGCLHGWFIDMGHLFGGAGGDQKSRHFIQSRYLDPRIYANIGSEEVSQFLEIIRSLDADALWRAARCLPEEWVSASAIRAFFRGLDAVANLDLVQSTLQILVDTQKQKHENHPSRAIEDLEPMAPNIQIPAMRSPKIVAKTG